ncbi:MAG: reverse transcriptase-like protein [Deltaproteobacteria bacterium]|nr:reverse transcriptase-like protein [Deltaproteobacteria bacterium]
MESEAVAPRASAGPDAVYLFCDGACRGNPGPMGIGVLLRYGRAEKLIAEPIGRGTSNVAELSAIERGLREIRRRDLPVVIVSDSSYAIGVLSGRLRAHANVDLVRRVAELIAGFKDIRFRRVRGHAGMPENEEVDRLAVRAAAEGFRCDDLRSLPIPGVPEP